MSQQPPEHPYGEHEKPRRIARVDVRGKDPELWSTIRAKLIAWINDLLDSTADHSTGTTVRDEIKNFTSAMLDFAKNKLAREGVEIQRLEAEISEIYAKQRKTLAEADKLNAEAKAIQIQNSTNQLVITLGLTKVMLVGEEGEEALLLGRQIDEFLAFVKEMGLISGA